MERGAIVGGFLGLGNSSAKTDRGNQLAGINASWNVFNRGLPMADELSKAGTATTATGLNTLDQAKQYWQSLVSGTRPAINKPQAMATAAPAINSLTEQADAAKKQQAELGTSRGGGVAEGNQQVGTQVAAKSADILGATGLKQQEDTMAATAAGAKGLESVGTAQTNVGSRQLINALQSLGLSQDTANEIINSSIQSRPISMKANADVRQQWSNLLAALGL